MAAHQIPSGNQGWRQGARGTGHRASSRFFERRSLGKRQYQRRNGPVGVPLSGLWPQLGAERPDMSEAAPRHIPVLGSEAVEMLGVRDGGIYVDATFGAGGYSRMILDGQRHPCHRHRSRPYRHIGRFRSGRAIGWPSHAGRGPLFQSGRSLRRAGFCRGRRRRAWMSAFPRCSSTRPTAASRFVSTARSTCGWDRMARARRM